MQSKKALITFATAGLIASAGAFAGDEMVQSGGYQGWGPMANLETPYSPSENTSVRYDEELRERAQHVTEVNEMRDQVWAANAPLRSIHEDHSVATAKQNMLLAPFRELARLFNFQKSESNESHATSE